VAIASEASIPAVSSFQRQFFPIGDREPPLRLFKNTTDESEYVLTLIINYLLIAFEFYAPCAPWRSEPPWWNTYSIAHNLQCATFQHFRLGASIAVWESQRTSQLSPPFLPRSYIGTAGLNPKLGGVGCNSVPDPSPCIL
jgi:hypothetical protein